MPSFYLMVRKTNWSYSEVSGRVESSLPASGSFTFADDPAQNIRRHASAQRGMRLDEPGDVRQIFLPLAGPTLRIAEGLELARERILQAGHARQDAMHVGRHGAGRELAIEVLHPDLHADARMAGPLKPLRGKPALVQRRQTADHAPRNFTRLQGLDEPGHVAAAAGGLPVVELPHCHASDSTERKS